MVKYIKPNMNLSLMDMHPLIQTYMPLAHYSLGGSVHLLLRRGMLPDTADDTRWREGFLVIKTVFDLGL